jgi:lipoprotein NlpD
MNRLLMACVVAVLLSACAEHPPAVIENRSVKRVDVAPEVRQSMPSEQPSPPSERQSAPSEQQVLDTGLPQGPDYRVQQGDTLYSVAFRLGMDYRVLAQINEIDPPFTILVGEPLRTVPPVLSPQPAPDSAVSTPVTTPVTIPVTTPVTTPVTAVDTRPKPVPKPTTAAVTPVAEKKPVTVTPAEPKFSNAPVSRWLWPASGTVSRGFAGDRNKGLDLVGQRGDPVVATADGVVVYAGSDVTGYGALLIVKHNDTYLSAYGHNDALLVNEGAFVSAGETIAKMGSTSAESVKLHFEIRRNGIPIDPMTVLPSR